jgi:hypothetical protein
LHGSWYRQTFAHNTVCVDEQSQKPTTGKLELTHFTPEIVVAQASSDDAYPGVLLRRRVAVFDGLVLDVFETSSGEEHTYDYLYHNFGNLRPGLDTVSRDEPLAKGAGYQHMADVRSASTSGDWSATFEQEGANVRTIMLGEDGTDLFFGEGVANNPPVPCPMFVARRRGKATQFATLIEPYRDQPTVTGFRQVNAPDGVVAFEVRCRGKRHRIALADTPVWQATGGGSGRVLYAQDTVEEGAP